MDSEIIPIVSEIVISIISLIGLFFYLRYKSFSKHLIRKIIIAYSIFLYVLATINIYYSRFFYRYYEWGLRDNDFTNFVVYYFPRLLPFILPLLFIFWFIHNNIRSSSEEKPEEVLFNYKNRIKDYIENIFNSTEFLTTLKTSLPKHNEDKKYGLDFVPFMLENIEQRRKRFARSSQVFFILTIFLGIIFSSVVIYFGYIFINEQSAGVPRLLHNIEAKADNINNLISETIPNYSVNESFNSIVKPDIEYLKYEKIPDSLKAIGEKLSANINVAMNNGDFYLLKESLLSAKDTLIKILPENNTYLKYLIAASNNMTSFYNSYVSFLPLVESNIQELKALVEKGNLTIEQPENRTAELIKRIAIGLIVSSFFLALLRFVAKIYLSRHQEMLKAEYDDFAIRRFYTAYKSSEDNPEARKGILLSFMNLGVNESHYEDSRLDITDLKTSLIDGIQKILNKN